MVHTKFSWKVFISISLFFSFFIIFFTGSILYLSPAGRVAHWVNWKFIGLTKEQWQSVHTVFSYLFAILSIFHLFFMNWKAFWSYIKSKVSKGVNKKREFYYSSIATILVFIAILFKIPPFSTIMDFGEYLTASWEKIEEQAPVPHAEKLTIPLLMEQIDGVSTEQAINRLRNNKIEVNDLSMTLEEIGKLYSISPIKIYKIISYKPAQNMAGSGIGKKTLEQLAIENSADISEYLNILEGKGILAKKTQTLKEIASEYDMPARDIYQFLFGEIK